MKIDSRWCRHIAVTIAAAWLVAACGGGGGGGTVDGSASVIGGGGSDPVTTPASPPSSLPPSETSPPPPPSQPQSAPLIVQQPVSQNAVEDAPVTFAVALQDASGAAYQWMRNGVDIVGATAPNYTLPAAAWGDDGALWSVRVSNVAGSVVSSAAKLTLTERRVETPVGISVFSRAPVDERPIGIDSRGNVITVSLDTSHPVLRKYSPSGAPRPYGSYPQGIALAPPQARRSGTSNIVQYMMFAMDASDNVDVGYTEITDIPVADSSVASPTACEIYVISPAGETRLIYKANRAFPTVSLRQPFDPGFVAAYSIAAGDQGLYLTDGASRSIGKLAADGTLTQVSAPSSVDIPFFGISGASQLAIDLSGTIYLNRARTISKIGPQGQAILVAGNTNPFQLPGLTDGTGGAANFISPSALVSDAAGMVYVLDDAYIRQVTPAGEVATLAGGSADPLHPIARYLYAGVESGHGLVIDRDGILYFKANGSIVKLRLQ